MNPGCRTSGLFLVLLALLLALPVAADTWQARQWPHTASEWIRLALLPGALWGHLRCVRRKGALPDHPEAAPTAELARG